MLCCRGTFLFIEYQYAEYQIVQNCANTDSNQSQIVMKNSQSNVIAIIDSYHFALPKKRRFQIVIRILKCSYTSINID